MVYRLLFAGIVLLALSACSTTKTSPEEVLSTQPEWILNPPQEQGAIYGVGSAENLGSLAEAEVRARDMATANLMREIEVDVKAESHIVISQQESTAKGYSSERSLQQEISTRVPEMRFTYLNAVNSFYDESHKQLYVLVRLDVASELSMAQKRARELEDKIEETSKVALDKKSRPLPRVQHSAQTLVALEERRRLHQFSKKLHPQGEGLPLSSDLKTLERKVVDRMAETPVSISPLGGQGVDITISQVLTEQLGKRGLVVLPADSEMAGELQLKYRLKQTNLFHDDTFLVTIDGVVELQDHKGRILRSLNSSAQGASMSEDLAIRRALAKLGKRAATNVVEVLFGSE